MDYDAKLKELYIDLPEPRSLGAGLVPAVRVGKLLFVGSVLPFADGRLVARGHVGVDVKLDTARLAARAACVAALAIVAHETGGTLNRVVRIVRLDAAVSSGAEFRDHEKVADAASDLLVQIFGAMGRHARTVVGAASLPHDACVSLSLIVETK